MTAPAAHLLAAHLLVFLPAGCSERMPAGPQAAIAAPQSSDFFSSAVGYFASRARVPILVDPRPIRPEAALNTLAERDLMPSDTQTIRMRTRVVEAAGWRTTDAPADWRCVFSRGVQLPRADASDSLSPLRQACRERDPYESLVFGLPQAGTDPAHPDRWRIRSLRMLSYGYEVVDLFLERAPNGTWAVVDARVRTGVFS